MLHHGLCYASTLLVAEALASAAAAQNPGADYIAGGPMGPPAPGIVAVRSPVRLASGPDGRIWVSDHERSKILLVDPATLEVAEEFSVSGRPLGLAIMGGRVFVGNETEGRVDVYDTDGFFSFSFASTLGRPSALAASEFHGIVAVVAGQDRLIRLFDPNGIPLGVVPSFDQPPLGNPSGVALIQDPLAEDVNGDGVVGIDDFLAVLAAWGTPDPAADVNGDGAVAIDDFLAILANWDRTLPPPRILVSDIGDPDPDAPIAPSVRMYDLEGTELQSCSGTGVFSRPQGLAVRDDGRLVVADSLRCQLLVLDEQTGQLLDTYGSFGSGVGELNLPLDVMIESESGRLLVTDNQNRRVTAFEAGGVNP